MTELDIIPLDFVKDQILKIDYPDMDDRIEGLIKTAVSVVEQYTDHALFQRQKVIYGNSRSTQITTFPVSVGLVTNDTGEAQNISVDHGSLSIYVKAPYPNTINLTIGYASTAEVPGALLEACYKLIVYMFENTDAYSATIPSDVQLILNPFRRSPTI